MAVIFVMLSHASISGLRFAPWLDFSGSGKYGVYLFFILSSYLLDRQIIIALREGYASTGFWANYFVRRFLRIFPLYVAVLVINYLLTQNQFPHKIELSGAQLWRHIFLQEGVSVFWSIPVEFKYYFVSPLLVVFYDKVLKWNIPLMLGTAGAIILGSVLANRMLDLGPVSLIKFLPIFLFGTLLALVDVLAHEKLKNLDRTRKTLLEMISLGALSGVALLIPPLFMAVTGREIRLDFFHNWFLLFAALWTVFIFCFKYGRGWISRVLSFDGLRIFGVFSFSLYLVHLPVLSWVGTFNLASNSMKTLVFFGISLIFSLLIYILVERPLSLIKVKYEKKSA